MVTFLDGVVREAADFDADALRELGRCLASLQLALRGFFHPAAGRTHLWDLRGTPGLVAFLGEVDDGERRAVAARVIDRFDKHVGPALPACRAQVIHDDLTSDNVVFDPDEPRVTGIIDFGDLLHGPLVCDLAVTAATVTLGHVDPFKAIGEVIAGYSSLTPLEPEEIDLLPDLVAARLAAWVLIAAWRVKRHPENAQYINAWVEEAWQILELFDGLGAPEVHRRFRELAVAHKLYDYLSPGYGLLPRHKRQKCDAGRGRSRHRRICRTHKTPRSSRGTGKSLLRFGACNRLLGN